MRRAIALTVVTSLAAACGGPTWPSRATTVTSVPLATKAAPIRSIDILPVDLEVWSDPNATSDDPDTVRASAEARLVGVASETFYRRGYSVGAVMDWSGSYVGSDGSTQVALAGPALLATVDSLASYGTAVADTNTLPSPFLPARLGEHTGGDATLYVGGWGFVGKEPEPKGAMVGKIIVGTILVVGIVAILIVAAKSDSKLDGLGKAAGGAARGVATAATSVGRTALKASLKVGSAALEVGKAVVQTGEGAELVLDILGRTATHVTLVSGRPQWSAAPTTPRKGRPRMYLEMTLVDNRTGEVLWHAHQQFPANAARPDDVMKAAKTLLASLPVR